MDMPPLTKIIVWLVAALIVVNLLYGGLMVYIVNQSVQQRNHTEHIAEENLKANCIDRRVLENRIIGTEAILRVIPGPTPIADISRASLERGLQRDKEFLEAKDFLDCDSVEGLPPKVTIQEAEEAAREIHDSQ